MSTETRDAHQCSSRQIRTVAAQRADPLLLRDGERSGLDVIAMRAEELAAEEHNARNVERHE
jgi:hypothetical protein